MQGPPTDRVGPTGQRGPGRGRVQPCLPRESRPGRRRGDGPEAPLDGSASASCHLGRPQPPRGVGHLRTVASEAGRDRADSVPPVLRIAFVSAPGSSVFMEELLAGVGDAVRRVGGARTSRSSPTTAWCPTWSTARPSRSSYRTSTWPSPPTSRQPCWPAPSPSAWSTRVRRTFRASVVPRRGSVPGSRSRSARWKRLPTRGLDGTLFPMGYVPRWDLWGGLPVDRDVDVVYLGTADPRRPAASGHAARSLVRVAHRAADPAARADDRGRGLTSSSVRTSGGSWRGARSSSTCIAVRRPRWSGSGSWRRSTTAAWSSPRRRRTSAR